MSTLTSLDPSSVNASSASDASVVSVRSVDFKQTVGHLIEDKSLDTKDLVVEAMTLIDRLSNNPEKNVYACSGSPSVDLHAILREMINHAEGCGGTKGRRYAASAVVACGRYGDHGTPNTIGLLRDLGMTWLSHLLFVCECSHRLRFAGFQLILAQSESMDLIPINGVKHPHSTPLLLAKKHIP